MKFEEILSAIIKTKQNPMPQPKFDVDEIARVTAKKVEEREKINITAKDIKKDQK